MISRNNARFALRLTTLFALTLSMIVISVAVSETSRAAFVESVTRVLAATDANPPLAEPESGISDDDAAQGAGATYTWNQTGTAAWGTATNWTPSRTTPLSTDILLFNNGANTTATGFSTQTISKLIISNNTTLNLQSTVSTALTIGGGSGADLDIGAGSALNINGSNLLNISVATGATASISGSMSTSIAGEQLTAADANGITFNSGASFTQGGTGGSGNVFGSGTADSVVFASGSTFIQNAGANPFQKTAPASVVVFQTGSNYVHQHSGVPSFSGRTYANFTLNAGVTISPIGSSAVSIDDLTVSQGTMNFNVTATPGHSIKGNISVASGATLNFAPASAGTVNLNGSSTQTVSGTGTITATSANSTFVVNNANGISLSRDLTLSNGTLTLTSGNIATGANTLTIGATETVNRTTGYVIGNLKKNYASAGAKTFEVGTANGYSPVAVNVTAGTFPADLTVKAVQGAQPNIPDPAKALSRHWTLTGSGITADLTFNYLDPADIPGTATEANFVIQKYNGAFTQPGGSVNTGANTASITGVTSFSDWTLAEPAAFGGPEIDVRGNGNSITSGDTTPEVNDRTDFGQANVNGSSVSHPFNIHNTGAATLNLTGNPDRVVISGTNAGDFTVNPQPAASVAPAGSTGFTITFDPSAGGTRTATVSIANDDADENPYTFSIQGEGLVSQYRTVQSGNWNDTATWEVSTDGGSNWNPAATTPNSGDGPIATTGGNSGYSVTVTASVTADQVTIGGNSLVVDPGVTFTIADGPGTDLTVNGGAGFATSGPVVNNGQTLINGTFALFEGSTLTGNALAYGAGPIPMLQYSYNTDHTTSDLEFPASNGPQRLQIANAFGSGITLHASRTVPVQLALQNGNLSTGANTLTLACGGSIFNGGPASYVIGNFARDVCATGSFTFPTGTTPNGVGRPNNGTSEGVPAEYSPVTINVTALGTNPSTLTVSVTDDFLPGVVQNGAVSRYWTVTENGDLTADLAMTYLDEDVNGNEADYKPFRRAGGFTTEYSPFTTNPGTNTTTALGVTDFSDWGIGKTIPTAAGVDVAGRVVTADGRGVSRARVAMTDQQGNAVYAITNPFGYYRFIGVPSGQDYVVSVASKQYTFVSRVVSVTDNLAGLDFVADP